MTKNPRENRLRAFGRSVKAKGGNATAFLRKLPARTISDFKRFYGTGWFPVSLLAAVILLSVTCVTIYIRQRPARQANVTTIQAQPVPLQPKPKDKALDQQRIWILLKPELMLFGLVGFVPVAGFTIWAARTRVRPRSAVMIYGSVLMLAGLALVGVNYLTDVLAFQTLTDNGYLVFQKHNGMLFWLFAFLPSGFGAGVFINAITSMEF
jgi:hypothetical protein